MRRDRYKSFGRMQGVAIQDAYSSAAFKPGSFQLGVEPTTSHSVSDHM